MRSLGRRFAPLVVLFAGCLSREGAASDAASSDAGALDLGPPACDSNHACMHGQRCHDGQCIPDNGPCTRDADCENDSYCDCSAPDVDAGTCPGGVCVPWGRLPRGLYDPTCRQPPFDVAEVTPPVVKCSTGNGAETTPLVADLDGDGKPEIIYVEAGYGFRAIHAADCSPYFEQQFGFAEWNASQLAVADLDGDGAPEIVGVDRSHRVAVFDHQGNLLASEVNPYSFTDAEGDLGGPSIVDIDGKAPPEIVMGGQVMVYTPKPMPALKELWQQSVSLPYWGSLSIAADLDGDQLPEVISGKQIFSPSSGTEITPAALKMLDGPGAYAAVGDFNADGKPDLVLVESSVALSRVSIFDWANQRFLFGPLEGSNSWGGAPTVADFDGDGKPEFGVGAIHDYTVYSPDCVGDHRPAKCNPFLDGVLWRKRIQDLSSGSCAAVGFDINGDGAAEVIYRDECWLRAYDGRTGKVLFALPVPSATGLEEPVVADIDNDGHAEIIVSSNGFPQCADAAVEPDTGQKWHPGDTGILVLTDPTHKWMPGRPVWNEHAYHITNINDDLSVPERELASWTRWNNYRANEQGVTGQPGGIADFTARASLVADTRTMDCAAAWTLHADICNRGAGTVQKGVPGAFYLSDPRSGSPMPVCTVVTTTGLDPGACQSLQCDYLKPPAFSKVDLWFRADDDGKGNAPHFECKTNNDVLYLPAASCNNLQ